MRRRPTLGDVCSCCTHSRRANRSALTRILSALRLSAPQCSFVRHSHIMMQISQRLACSDLESSISEADNFRSNLQAMHCTSAAAVAIYYRTRQSPHEQPTFMSIPRFDHEPHELKLGQIADGNVWPTQRFDWHCFMRD